jgi:hypothetical protein
MNRVKKNGFLVLLCFLLAGCVTDTVDEDLSGSWTCKETSDIFSLKGTKGTSVYQVSITRDASDSDVYYMDNFYKLGSGVKVTALVTGNTITIPSQESDGFAFAGTGTIDGSFNTINMTYTADDHGGTVDHVTAEYTR